MVLEGINKSRWLRLFAVVIVVTVSRVMLQPLMPSGDNGILSEPSIFVKAGLLVPVFILYAFMIFFASALVFVLLERRLHGSRLRKGATFGLAYGLLWFLYFLEPLTTGPARSLIVTLAYPVVDGTTFLLLGLLLGRFAGTDSPATKSVSRGPGILLLAIIPIVFVAMRYCAYNANIFFSAFDARTFDTMLWAAATGIWLGAIYFLFRPGIPGKPVEKAVLFGIGAIGVNLLLFNLLIPLVFAADPVDLVLRTAVDAMAAVIGVYIYEKVGAIAHNRSTAAS